MNRKVGPGAWFVPSVVVSFIFAMAGPAYASCAEPLPIGQALAEAQTVFVATVIGLEHNDRLATFQVEEIWKGAIGATVRVSGGPSPSEIGLAASEGSTVITSVDRTYVLGETYLVESYGAEGEVLLDNICSATQVYRTELDQYRPSSAHSPMAAETSADSPFWAWSVLSVGGIVGLASLVTRRVRRHRSSDPVVS